MELAQQNYNVSRFLAQRAEKFPEKIATILADGRSISFAQMEHETQRMAAQMRLAGIEQGMRVATFIRPSLDFVPAIFALFRIGAVPVFVDPGMRLKHMLACLREVGAEAVVGIPLAHTLSALFRRSFATARIRVLVGDRSLWNRLHGATIIAPVKPSSDRVEPKSPAPMVTLDRDAPAAIIFTSGSTGVPKGVEVTHGILDGQTQILRETFAIGDDEVDLVPFPLFALFSAAWGITSVIPDMDPAKPAQVDGLKLADLIEQHGVTHTAGSPAIWRRLFDACIESQRTLPTLRRILMAGAPIPSKVLRDSREVMAAEAEVFTPYGATEALPVTSIGSRELLAECLEETGSGRGTCVGRPLNGIDVRVVRIEDGAIADIAQTHRLADEEVGEVIVRGPLVTRSYFNRPESNTMAKISDGDGFWHRMGDLGYFDAQGRLWFCGRKDHRVRGDRELYPVQCEGIFNQHPDVTRSAVVGVADDTPVLVIQSNKAQGRERLRQELLAIAQANPLTVNIRQVCFRQKFPVDVRHNIKINRPLLAKQVKRSSEVR